MVAELASESQAWVGNVCSAPGEFADRSAVLFDFDGTLVDTGPAVMRIAARSLLEHGYDLHEVGDLRVLLGPPLEDGFMMVARVEREEARRLVDTYRAIFDAEITPADYPPFPGMVGILEGLRARGTKIAVATSRLDTTAREMIDALKLPPFDAIAGRLEPGRMSKADCIRACLQGLGFEPSEVVMVGDRHYDVLGAHEVGMPCIGVYQDEPSRMELSDAGVDALCADTAALGRLLGIENVACEAR